MNGMRYDTYTANDGTGLKILVETGQAIWHAGLRFGKWAKPQSTLFDKGTNSSNRNERGEYCRNDGLGPNCPGGRTLEDLKEALGFDGSRQDYLDWGMTGRTFDFRTADELTNEGSMWGGTAMMLATAKAAKHIEVETEAESDEQAIARILEEEDIRREMREMLAEEEDIRREMREMLAEEPIISERSDCQFAWKCDTPCDPETCLYAQEVNGVSSDDDYDASEWDYFEHEESPHYDDAHEMIMADPRAERIRVKHAMNSSYNRSKHGKKRKGGRRPPHHQLTENEEFARVGFRNNGKMPFYKNRPALLTDEDQVLAESHDDRLDDDEYDESFFYYYEEYPYDYDSPPSI